MSVIREWIDRTARQAGPVTASELAEASQDEQRAWRQFRFFAEHYQPEWLSGQLTARSDAYGYTVTADWSARIDGTTVVGLLITRKHLYPSLGQQLAAVIRADRWQADSDGRFLPNPERCGVLHVRPLFSRLVPVKHIDESFRQILALKVCADFDAAKAEAAERRG